MTKVGRGGDYSMCVDNSHHETSGRWRVDTYFTRDGSISKHIMKLAYNKKTNRGIFKTLIWTTFLNICPEKMILKYFCVRKRKSAIKPRPTTNRENFITHIKDKSITIIFLFSDHKHVKKFLENSFLTKRWWKCLREGCGNCWEKTKTWGEWGVIWRTSFRVRCAWFWIVTVPCVSWMVVGNFPFISLNVSLLIYEAGILRSFLIGLW